MAATESNYFKDSWSASLNRARACDFQYDAGATLCAVLRKATAYRCYRWLGGAVWKIGTSDVPFWLLERTVTGVPF
jgi:hypothetical protein